MLANWVKETTVTTGIGDIVLSGADTGGFVTVSTMFADASYLRYVVEDGNYRENGIAKYVSATNKLVRWYVLEKLDAGGYAAHPATPLSLSGAAKVGIASIDDDVGGWNAKILRAGAYIVSDVVTNSTGNGTINTHALVAAPISINAPITLSELSVRITTAGSTGAFRLAIYRANRSTRLPGKLMAETADQTFAPAGSTAGTIGGGAVKIPPGLYWLIYWGNTDAQFRRVTTGNAFPLGTAWPDIAGQYCDTCLYKSGVTFTPASSSFAANVGNDITGWASAVSAPNNITPVIAAKVVTNA